MESGGIPKICSDILADIEQRDTGLSKPRRLGLANLVSCMLSERTANLMVLAATLPRPIKHNEKRYQYISRFLASDEVDVTLVMASYGRELCENMTAYGEQLLLILDQSKVGNGFEVLMVSVSMGGRSLPLLWYVKKTKGAIGFSEEKQLLEKVYQMLSEDFSILLMADRFYGTPSMVEWCQNHQWSYRIRLKGNLIFQHQGGEITGRDAAALGVKISNGACFNEKEVKTNIGILQDPGYDEPWIVALDCPASEYKTRDYGIRWGIEPMFSDFKTRGFGITETQLEHADRIERLILVMALAMYWSTSAGMSDETPLPKSPSKRFRSWCSLFTTGLRLIIRVIRHGLPVPPLWARWKTEGW